MSTRQKLSVILTSLALLSTAACVHADVTRTGRMRLGGGREGTVPVVTNIPDGYREVAIITVHANLVDTPKRRTRHMVRRASLLGCDAVAQLSHGDEASRGSCVRRYEPEAAAVAEVVVAAPSNTLLAQAAAAGAEGAPLVRVLRQSQSRTGDARAWPLRWYLDNYPSSPFRAQVEALFVTKSEQMLASGAPSSVRTAPTTK